MIAMPMSLIVPAVLLIVGCGKTIVDPPWAVAQFFKKDPSVHPETCTLVASKARASCAPPPGVWVVRLTVTSNVAPGTTGVVGAKTATAAPPAAVAVKVISDPVAVVDPETALAR
jgi:hypothetical protein